MPPRSRRTLIRTLALSAAGPAVAALAGCTSAPDGGASTDSTTRTTAAADTRSPPATETTPPPTETTPPPTETARPLPDGALSFSAEAASQATADSPPRVVARLTNETDRRVSLRMGPALLFSDTGPGEKVRSPYPLVVSPETNVGPNEPPTERVDGCWRWESARFVQSILETYRLDPGESLSERYGVYTSASADECLPPGEYYLDDVADVAGGRLTLTLVLAVADDRTLSARAALSGTGAPAGDGGAATGESPATDA